MSEKINLDTHDRSISSLRTLRMPEDNDIFWFRDDLHQPYPISPLGMTTVQKHHAWGYHVGADAVKLPPSKGGHVKIHKGRVMLGFEAIADPEEVSRRSVEFNRVLEYVRSNWDEWYNGHIDEVKQGLILMGSVNDGMSDADLHRTLVRAEALNKRAWEIHFICMYVTDVLYFGFEAFCKQHGLEEKDFTGMLKGHDTMATKTDKGMWSLAKLAIELGLAEKILSTDPKLVLLDLKKDAHAAAWMTALDAFLAAYGHRITAAHLDVLFSTWIEDPSPVIETLQTYIPKVREGWDIGTERAEMLNEGETAANTFIATLGKTEATEFKKQLAIAKKVYQFQEDHGFYIDGASTAGLRDVAMACGRRLVQYGLLRQADDVCFLNYSDLAEIMEGLSQYKDAAIYHYRRLTLPLVKERREGWSQSVADQEAPLTMGTIPQKLEDPILIKVFGMVDELLKVGKVEELKMMDIFEGYPGAPGVAEGVARVVKSFEGFAGLETGEILVCPYTATAWTPLFPKIKAIVTDTGGMLTHAAIAAREYRIPAVVGTWRATRAIHDGDYIRVNGDTGVVEILKKAYAHISVGQAQ